MLSVFQNLETSSAAAEVAVESIDAKTPTLLSGAQPVAVRRDDDTGTAVDGAPSPLFVNSVGRLKVSAMPGIYESITGSITAIQPVANTPVAGATVPVNTSLISNLTLYCSGTFAGYNVIFEASLDSTNGTDGLWFGIQAARTNANVVETVTGVLGAAPVYAWEMSVNAYAWVRVRATARTSGTQVWRITPGAYATEPIPSIQTHPVTGSGTFTVAGTVTANTAPVTPTTTRTVLLATTNILLIRNAAAALYALSVFNSSASTIFVKLYNLNVAPTLASSVPTLIIPVLAGAMVTHQFGVQGEQFSAGISLAVTGAVGNTDTTAVAAGVNVNVTWR